MSNLEEFALMVSELIHTGEVKRKKWFLWEVIKKIPNVGFVIVTSQAPLPKMSRKLVTFLFTYSKIGLAPCFVALFSNELLGLASALGESNISRIAIKYTFVMFHLVTLVNVTKNIESALEPSSYAPTALVMAYRVSTTYLSQRVVKARKPSSKYLLMRNRILILMKDKNWLSQYEPVPETNENFKDFSQKQMKLSRISAIAKSFAHSVHNLQVKELEMRKDENITNLDKILDIQYRLTATMYENMFAKGEFVEIKIPHILSAEQEKTLNRLCRNYYREPVVIKSRDETAEINETNESLFENEK